MILLRIPLIVLVVLLVFLITPPFILLFWWHPSRFVIITGLFARLFLWASGLKVDLQGLEHLDPKNGSYVFVGNHQSNWDYLHFGIIAFPRTVSVGKKELLYFPPVGWPYWALGNILIDRKKKQEAISRLSLAAEYMRKNNGSVIMFPEGTRNRAQNGLLPFKKGVFYLAIETQRPLVAIVCERIGPMVDWKRLKFRSRPVKVRILPPVSTTDLQASDAGDLKNRVRDEMLRVYEEISS